MSEKRKLRVAVIGAGAGGLVALRHLRDRLDTFQPIAFEQTPHVGGTWVYTDDVGIDSTTGRPVHSSMYRHLCVNLPKEVLRFTLSTVTGQINRLAIRRSQVPVLAIA